MAFQKGHHSLTEFKKGHKLNEKRYLRYPKLKKQISDKLKGKKKSRETRGRMKISQTGHKLSEEGKQKLRDANWQGGKSFEPYSVDWTKTLKRAVRERDKYTCQICGKEPAIDCHHIDYNKKNCNPENLIIVCKKCHGKTNHNRCYWINYFNNGKKFR